jgi:hypothetical protein
MWEHEHGPIPEGMYVLHTCDNKVCIEPSHLFLGTKKDNSIDMAKKGRTGSASGKPYLTPEVVLQIKQALAARVLTGRTTQTRIAEEFGVRIGVVNSILHGRTWAHTGD